MFKKLLRIKNRRAIALVIVGALALPFILFFHWGGGIGSGPGPGGTAGILFGRPVPWEQYQQEYGLLRREFQTQLGGTVPEAFEPLLRQQTWDRLILREAARRQVRVENEEVARHLQSQPTFQRDGRFDPALYFQFVRAIGSSPQLFEERIRDDLRIQQLLETVKAQAQVSEEEVRTAYAEEHDRLRAALVVIRAEAFEPEARRTLTDEILRDYYAAHPEAVRRPARRTIEYLHRSYGELQDAIPPVPDEALQAAYDERADELKREDGSVPPLAEIRDTLRQHLQDEQVARRLREAALDLQEDTEQGLRFEEIAAARGLQIHPAGPLEPSSPGIPDGPTAPMLRAAFDLPLGQMTEVFETPLGVFLLRSAEETPSHIPPFEEVKDPLEQQVLKKRSRDAAQARAAEIRESLAAARARGLTIDEAFLVAGQTPIRPAPFTRHGGIDTLGEAPGVTEALFALSPGEGSPALDMPDGFVVAIVEERLPFDAARLAADRASFQQAVLAAKQQEHLAAWLEDLRAQARLKSFLEQTE